MYNGKWHRVWNNRLFSELNIGDFGYHFPQGPLVDYWTNPPRQPRTVQLGLRLEF
jgi:hypothetical protein